MRKNDETLIRLPNGEIVTADEVREETWFSLLGRLGRTLLVGALRVAANSIEGA